MKRIILTLLLVITAFSTYACDICGCNSGSYFIGPFPQFSRYFIGTRYSFQRYGTILREDRSQFSNDFYQTAELMASAIIKSKWQVMMYLPYNMIYSKSDDGINRNNGFGDLTLMGNYKLLDSKYLNRDTVTVSHQLWLGAGFKLPTGQFSVNADELVTSANLQPGSGSFSYMFNLLYIFQVKSWGVNFSSNYRINTPSDHYRFGNRLTLTSFVYRSFSVGNVSISPNIGMLYETMDSNTNDHQEVADTGGNDLLSAAGFEIRFRNVVFGCNGQLPLASNLSGGQTDARFRGMCHLSLMF